MNTPDIANKTIAKKIIPKQINDQVVTIPGSKSISHRMMICACLSDGKSTIDNLLNSEDIQLTMKTLRYMGADIKNIKDIKNIADNKYEVTGFNGHPKGYDKDIYLGNSGTSMRLLTGIAALGSSLYTLTGDTRMCERPMIELLDALTMLGIHAKSKNDLGTPPVNIRGDNRDGGKVKIDCSKSSQYLSSLLMMGAKLKNGLDISLDTPPVSVPYVDLTMDIMKKFQVEAHRIDATHYHVPGQQSYVPGDLFVEPDLSNAGYFWAIGAITGKMISVNNININSLQGDLKQIKILEKMGCTLKIEDNQIGICGSALKGIDIDMADTPDAVPAIAVVASFAEGKTKITNIGHLRVKECDRIDAVASQLIKMGIEVEQGDDYIVVTGGKPKAARIDTFNDHRIAMAFAIPGLKIEGMEIENETCVAKSFPDYWKIFDAL